MSFKTTVILAVLLLVIAGVLWMYGGRAATVDVAPPGQVKPEEPKYVFDPRPDTGGLVKLVIERPGTQRVVFERSPKPDTPAQLDDWRMVEPQAAAVENSAVNSIVTAIANLQSRSRFEPGKAGAVNESETGLAPPQATVTLTDKGGKELKLEIGQIVAMSKDTYVRVAGQPTVQVASRDLQPDLRKPPNDFRAKSLAKFTADSAVALKIEHAGKVFDLSRGADREWVLNAPTKSYADGEKVKALLTKLSTLRADSFVDDAAGGAAAYGFDEPFLTITVTTETKRPLPPETQPATTAPAEPRFETVQKTYGVVVGGFADLKSEKRYARVPDQPGAATVRQTDVNGLVPEMTLRDARITRLKTGEAATVALTTAGKSTTLKKEQGVWHGEGDLVDLEAPALIDLLEAFEDLKAIDYADAGTDPAKFGLDAPRATITVTATGQVNPVTLRVGADTASSRNTYVQREGDPTVFVVSAAQAKRLLLSPLSLRSRTMLRLLPDQIRTISLQRPDARYAMTKQGIVWTISEPEGAPVDGNTLQGLTRNLAGLTARNVVGKGDDANFGLDQPSVTIRFAAEIPVVDASQPATLPATQPATGPAAQRTQPVEHVLRIGRKNNIAYARCDDDPFIYELDESVYKALTGEPIDPVLFKFKPNEVVGYTAIAPAGRLELTKDGDQWKYVPDPFVPLDQKKVKDFLEELSKLRVDSWVAYRDADLAAQGLLDAPATVFVRLTQDRVLTLKLAQETPGQLPRIAGLVEEKRLFKLKTADVEKLLRGLETYAKAEGADKKDAGKPELGGPDLPMRPPPGGSDDE